ncbi:putative HTH-type transcriptional regulator [Candidatus Tiddalikarchaeum anstoanum]|nr:putative HTH-type transcriptional regulator [Candidatus Tiddalikarchaeum anstoanum]
MITAYILIVVKSGSEEKVAKRLSADQRVKDVNIVYGEYDIISKVTTENMEDLQKFIIKNIRSIKEVQRTSTMISLK